MGNSERGGLDELGPAPVVILARSQLGENVGTTARAMLNFGLSELRLVTPKFGWPNAKAVAAASGAHGILNRMTIHDSVADAASDLHHLYATTARPRGMSKPVMSPREAASDARASIGHDRRVGLLFGPERTGLDNDELALADAIVSIPVNPAFPSLNLAQAVLLTSYEWCLSGDAPRAAPASREVDDPPATKGDLARLLDHLLTELDQTGYFRSPDRRDSLSRTIRVMLERRQMTAPEVHLMRGIVKQLAGSQKSRKPD